MYQHWGLHKIERYDYQMYQNWGLHRIEAYTYQIYQNWGLPTLRLTITKCTKMEAYNCKYISKLRLTSKWRLQLSNVPKLRFILELRLTITKCTNIETYSKIEAYMQIEAYNYLILPKHWGLQLPNVQKFRLTVSKCTKMEVYLKLRLTITKCT